MCGETFPETEEYFEPCEKGKYKNGLRSWCRTCRLKQAAEYYVRNAEEIRARRKKRREENPERDRKYRRDAYNRNPQKYKELTRRWCEENAERHKEAKRQYHNRAMENPEYRISSSITGGVWRSLKNKKGGRSWESLVGYTTEELMAHLEPQFTKGMTWDNYGEWHIDHIRPRKDFQFDSPNDLEFKQCWSLWNLQPLWAKENLSKNARCENPPLPLVHK